MSKVYEFLADGFEEIEALTPVDILRRGGVDITTVSINTTKEVRGAHGIVVTADILFRDADYLDADLLLLPGGMPGAKNLLEHEGVCATILSHYQEGKRIGAICAAPMIFGYLGILHGKRATCYPGFEKFLEGAEYTGDLVTADGNITTGKGPGASFAYSYQLLSYFRDAEAVDCIKQGMMYQQEEDRRR